MEKLFISVLVAFAFKECCMSNVLDESQCLKFGCEYKVIERLVHLEYKNSELEKKQLIAERKNEELVEIVKEQRLEMERLHQEQAKTLTSIEEEVAKHAKEDNETIEKPDTLLSETEKTLTNAIDNLRLDMETANNADKAARNEMEKNLTLKFEAAVHEMAIKFPSVAFTARLNGGYRYNKGDTIKFDSVGTNIGSGYSTITGVFTAPQKGTYLFSLTLSLDAASANVYLMKENTQLGRIDPYDSTMGGHHDSESVSVVTELVKGDRVFAKFISGSRQGSYSLHKGNICTLTGLLFH